MGLGWWRSLAKPWECDMKFHRLARRMSIVSVALHTLAQELSSTVAVIQWVSTGYLLALGATIPLVGWAQARIGGKRLWMIALVIFAVGSIAASLAWSAPSLIAFRWCRASVAG